MCAGDRPLAAAVTATVRAAPFEASFSQVPGEHDGSTTFTFHFHLSTDSDSLSYRTVRDGLFDVTGGTVENARRLERGNSRDWSVDVVPDGSDDVTVRVRETTSCSGTGVCTADGRKLAGGQEITITGPAGLS